MFCRECGNKINDGANFCSNCGARVQVPNQQVQAPTPQAYQPTPTQYALPVQQPIVRNPYYGLPEGMTMQADGKIVWSYKDKKDEYLYYLDEEKLVEYRRVEKKDSPATSFAKDIVNFATVHSDTLTFMDEPFPEGEGSNVVEINGIKYYCNPIKFQYLSSLKEDRKHNIIKLHNTYWWNIHLVDEQYDFILNYVLSHCPNIKRK